MPSRLAKTQDLMSEHHLDSKSVKDLSTIGGYHEGHSWRLHGLSTAEQACDYAQVCLLWYT